MRSPLRGTVCAIAAFVAVALPHVRSMAQISPPGLGRANTASWFAVGIRQELDTVKVKQLVSYIGIGRKSDPDDRVPYHRSAIIVVNQEFYNEFHRHWLWSAAFSYRDQDEYVGSAPYEHAHPGTRQEFRVYGRFAYRLEHPRWKFAATLRQEVRAFFTPDLTPWEEDLQLRTRLRAQFAWNMDARKAHKLILGAEPLFAMDHAHDAAHAWSAMAYTESRFCLFFSAYPERSPFILSVGYMCDLVGRSDAYAAHYIALNAVWENPFGKLHRPKNRVDDNLE